LPKTCEKRENSKIHQPSLSRLTRVNVTKIVGDAEHFFGCIFKKIWCSYEKTSVSKKQFEIIHALPSFQFDTFDSIEVGFISRASG
jgi:hypothetical protein